MHIDATRPIDEAESDVRASLDTRETSRRLLSRQKVCRAPDVPTKTNAGHLYLRSSELRERRDGWHHSEPDCMTSGLPKGTRPQSSVSTRTRRSRGSAPDWRLPCLSPTHNPRPNVGIGEAVGALQANLHAASGLGVRCDE